MTGSCPPGADEPHILILGGTGEARQLARDLARWGSVNFTSSLAGRVRDPAMPVGRVRVGGFGGVDGLRAYLRAGHVTAVIDATHPFARHMSANADLACAAENIPRVVLRRPGWCEDSAHDDLRWHRVPTIEQVPTLISTIVHAGRTVFLTTGRLDLSVFSGDNHHHYLVRTVDTPDPGDLPPSHTLVLSRGPYTYDAELALMTKHDVTMLVTKDSGGDLTVAKLHAARELGIPVAVVERPPVPPGSTCVSNTTQALEWLTRALRIDHPAETVTAG